MTLGASLVTETTLHDPKRLQVQQLTASTVAAGNWHVNLYYCANESLLCTTNNGNIVRQKGYGGAAWDYSYDSLNRLELTTEKVGTVDKWQQRMKYDPFGNRWILNEAGTLIPNLEATPRAQLASDPSPFTTKNQWNGASYDPGGNQTTTWGNGTAIGSAIYSYDAENRIKKAEVNWPVGGAGVVEHGYDGDGRRIWKKVGGVVKTTFVYNAAGQLVAEYGESAAMPCTTCYLTADHLGSTRVVWGSDGAMKQLLDYAPFGEEVGANYRGGDVRYPGGLYPRPGGMGVSMEFTGKERDAETGLDYFGARYMSSAQGRFTSPDPLLASGRVGDPQSWNRYTYVRNNPLALIDPTGLDWVASGNASNPYSWVDKCEEGVVCYKSVAAIVSGNLSIYGSSNAKDVTVYGANEHGLINAVDVSSQHDAQYVSRQTPGREENYLAPAQAAALFNVANSYHTLYPSDEKLQFTGGSTAEGNSAIPGRQSHRGGLNIDLAYMGSDGKAVHGNTASANADILRMGTMFSLFAGQKASLGSPITGSPDRFGIPPISNLLSNGHRNHVHFQKTYPRVKK